MAITLRHIILQTNSKYDIPILLKTKKGYDAIESIELSDDESFIILKTYEQDQNNDLNK